MLLVFVVRKKFANAGVYVRHCNTAFKKHVLPIHKPDRFWRRFAVPFQSWKRIQVVAVFFLFIVYILSFLAILRVGIGIGTVSSSNLFLLLLFNPFNTIVLPTFRRPSDSVRVRHHSSVDGGSARLFVLSSSNKRVAFSRSSVLHLSKKKKKKREKEERKKEKREKRDSN